MEWPSSYGLRLVSLWLSAGEDGESLPELLVSSGARAPFLDGDEGKNCIAVSVAARRFIDAPFSIQTERPYAEWFQPSASYILRR